MSTVKNIDDFALHIEYTVSNPLGNDYCGYDQYIDHIDSKVYAYDMNRDKRRFAGNVRLIYFRFNEACNDEIPLVDIADADSQESYDYIVGLFKKGSFKPEYLDENSSFDVLVISRFLVVPAFRKTGLSQILVKSITKKYSTMCGPIIVQPFPLQINVDKSLDSPEFSKDHDVALKKVTDFWKSVGFTKEIAKTSNLLFDRSFLYKE